MTDKRLLWQCRRGTRELDFMTRYYLDHHYGGADAEERKAFRRLLELPDPLLHAILSGKVPGEDPATERIAGLIKEYCDHRTA